MEYKIIKDSTRGFNFTALEDEVNAYIAEGWRPAGGLSSVRNDRGDVTWVQAMVKDGAGKPKAKKKTK